MNNAAKLSEDCLAASDAEISMRRALGLGGQPTPQQHWHQSARDPDRHPQRRRFVSDGEVPVVMLSRRNQGADATTSSAAPSVNQLAVVETACRSEQDARRRAERALSEAQATIRDLQTKLGHAELAKDEAIASARRAEISRKALEVALDAERDTRLKAEEVRQHASQGREPVARRHPVKAPVTVPATIASPTRHRGRPLGSTNRVQKAAEPKPVRWW